MKSGRESTENTETQDDQKSVDIRYMQEALRVAEAALSIGEVPVGCVIVLRNHSILPMGESVIISHGANQVNATRDATRHAEIVAIDRLLTLGASSDLLRLSPAVEHTNHHGAGGFQLHKEARQKLWDDRWVNVSNQPGHWKNSFGWRNNNHPKLKSKEIFVDCDLYVTCEPCIMCGELL